MSKSAAAVLPHHHEPAHVEAILHRMSRAIGHLESIKRMVSSDADCTAVLIQLAAVKSAVNNIGREILKEHLTHCMVDALKQGDMGAITALNTAVDKFLK